MADFPAFGMANRDAPLFQKELFPDIEIQTNVVSPPNSPKTVTARISIVNLKSNLVAATLNRLFSYSLATANNELTASSIPVSTTELADIHFEININKAISQTLTPASTPGGLATQSTTTVITVNMDILIENLQITSLETTFERIKAYMSAAVASDLNP